MTRADGGAVKHGDAGHAVRPFAGLSPEIETFIERVPVSEISALERWSALRDEGWDVEALSYDDGGQVTELVGLGCRYRPALEATA